MRPEAIRGFYWSPAEEMGWSVRPGLTHLPILDPGRKEDQVSLTRSTWAESGRGVASGKITRVLPTKGAKWIPGEGQPQMPSIRREKLDHSNGLSVSEAGRPLKWAPAALLWGLLAWCPFCPCWWPRPRSLRGRGKGPPSVPLPWLLLFCWKILGHSCPPGALFILLNVLWVLATCQAGGRPCWPWAINSLLDTVGKISGAPRDLEASQGAGSSPAWGWGLGPPLP